MVAASNIGWSKYRGYEGPFFRGVQRFKVPARPTEEDRILAVITATEGGAYDSYNGYDGQICSLGLIQVTERAYYSVSSLLGALCREDKDMLTSMFSELSRKNLMFKPNHRGRYRFHFRDARSEVDTAEEQKQMFFFRSDGTRGSWDEASKIYATQMAAAICNIFSHHQAREHQSKYMAERVRAYAFGNSKSVIKSAPNTDLGRAFTAAYLSFAINNPTRANKHLSIALKSSRHTRWGLDWFLDVLKELTFGPKIAIYPHRYDAIRKPLEQHYNMDLPDFADELEQWDQFKFDPLEIQQALLALNYDLGPAGADGSYGKKTRAAMLSFEEANEVPEEMRDGMPDPISMTKLRNVLYTRGIELLSAA